MASNEIKVIDRTPFILPAGKRVYSENNVKLCLRNYSIDDAKETLNALAKTKETETFKHEPYVNKMRKGIFTQIQPILQPPTKTRYQTLINELKETSYDSHWNKVVGRTRDPIAGLPKGFNAIEHTFGCPYKFEETMKDLIHAPKVQAYPDDKYSGRGKICRNYSNTFDASKRFGMHTKYDPRGIWAKCACTWHINQKVVFTNKVQADFLNKTQNKLGKRSNINVNLPMDFTYGRSTKSKYNVDSLLKDYNCPPCKFKENLKCWLVDFNKMQIQFKNVLAGCNVTLDDIFKRFLYYDKQKTHKLPLATFYYICQCFRLFIAKENIEPLLEVLSIIDQGYINYAKFLELVEKNNLSLETIKIKDIPLNNQYYQTSTQAATCDYLLIDNSNAPTAGVGSIRYDLERPTTPAGSCRADLENLGDEASAAILLNPSIFCSYGLSFRDFFKPRDKNFLTKLFEKIGYQLNEQTIEKIWTEGMEQDKTGLVCVDTFNRLVEKHCQSSKHIIVDETSG